MHQHSGKFEHYEISSLEQKTSVQQKDLLNQEIEHLKTMFCNIDDIQKNVVNNIIQ